MSRLNGNFNKESFLLATALEQHFLGFKNGEPVQRGIIKDRRVPVKGEEAPSWVGASQGQEWVMVRLGFKQLAVLLNLGLVARTVDGLVSTALALGASS